jgi:hypothetical protein
MIVVRSALDAEGSCSTFSGGARLLVVHDPIETTSCLPF